MVQLCLSIKTQLETIHLAVAIFDAYLSCNEAELHLATLPHCWGQTKHHVVTLLAVVAAFCASKYHEKTYPGIK